MQPIPRGDCPRVGDIHLCGASQQGSALSAGAVDGQGQMDAQHQRHGNSPDHFAEYPPSIISTAPVKKLARSLAM